MGRPNHRIVGSSLTGRRMAQAKGTADRLGTSLDTIPAEIREHNEAIERARQKKLARRMHKDRG